MKNVKIRCRKKTRHDMHRKVSEIGGIYKIIGIVGLLDENNIIIKTR